MVRFYYMKDGGEEGPVTAQTILHMLNEGKLDLYDPVRGETHLMPMTVRRATFALRKPWEIRPAAKRSTRKPNTMDICFVVTMASAGLLILCGLIGLL